MTRLIVLVSALWCSQTCHQEVGSYLNCLIVPSYRAVNATWRLNNLLELQVSNWSGRGWRVNALDSRASEGLCSVVWNLERSEIPAGRGRTESPFPKTMILFPS